MTIIIIEDEVMTAEDLMEILLRMQENILVQKIIASVGEAIEYFKINPQPDLIFCDIQLGDGHCFEIFKEVPIDIPIIFCTAYDEYALEAFKHNGIDYILKPFVTQHVKSAIDKYKSLQSRFMKTHAGFDQLLQEIQSAKQRVKKNSTLLVNWKDKIIPVRLNEIALFNIEYKRTQLVTFDSRKYFVDNTLDELEQIAGDDFYRANRQFLVNRHAITEVLQYHARKLYLKLKVEDKNEIIISKNRTPEFLGWLRN